MFLAPDLSFVAYLAGARLGAAGYNAAHTYAGPIALGLALSVGGTVNPGLALIGAAHIGFDRVLGYGLKYNSRFGDPHLGVPGKPSAHP